MQGEIEQEKLNTSLLEIQNMHEKTASEVDGAAEADRAASFLEGLGKEVRARAAAGGGSPRVFGMVSHCVHGLFPPLQAQCVSVYPGCFEWCLCAAGPS